MNAAGRRVSEYAQLFWKLLMGYGEGCVNAAMTMDADGLSVIRAEFEKCVYRMKENFYKEDYLK